MLCFIKRKTEPVENNFGFIYGNKDERNHSYKEYLGEILNVDNFSNFLMRLFNLEKMYSGVEIEKQAPDQVPQGGYEGAHTNATVMPRSEVKQEAHTNYKKEITPEQIAETYKDVSVLWNLKWVKQQ